MFGIWLSFSVFFTPPLPAVFIAKSPDFCTIAQCQCVLRNLHVNSTASCKYRVNAAQISLSPTQTICFLCCPKWRNTVRRMPFSFKMETVCVDVYLI